MVVVLLVRSVAAGTARAISIFCCGNHSTATGGWEIFRAVVPAWIIGMQWYRGFGSMLLVLYSMNYLAREFVLTARFGAVDSVPRPGDPRAMRDTGRIQARYK